MLAADDEVDEINRSMYECVQGQIRKTPERMDSLIQMLAVSRNLERIADHTTNIAEDVIYMVDGEIVRHGANRPMLTACQSPSIVLSDWHPKSSSTGVQQFCYLRALN